METRVVDKQKMGRTQRYTQIPVYRVRNIMKNARDVGQVGNNASILVAKATELFLTLLTEESFEKSQDGTLEYKHVAEVVANEELFHFLREYIPQKITVRRYKEILKETQERNEEDEKFYL